MWGLMHGLLCLDHRQAQSLLLHRSSCTKKDLDFKHEGLYTVSFLDSYGVTLWSKPYSPKHLLGCFELEIKEFKPLKVTSLLLASLPKGSGSEAFKEGFAPDWKH